MYTKILFLLIVILNVNISFASLPDSIVIHDYTWGDIKSSQYKYLIINKGNKFQIFQSYKHIRYRKEIESSKTIKKGSISIENVVNLMNALFDTNYTTLQTKNFGYDDQWKNLHLEELFSQLKKKKNNWSKDQEIFVKQQLLIDSNYTQALRRVINREGIYYISKHGGAEFKVVFYFKNQKIQVNADDHPLGMPWSINNKKSYNPKISKLFAEILPKNESFNKNKFNSFEYLPMWLAESIYNDVCLNKIKELAPYEFINEINELKDSFDIVNMVEWNYGGRYIWNNNQTFKITLKNQQMLPGIFLQFMVQRQKNTIYSRDSLLAESYEIVQRVQTIKFLVDFLSENSSRKLDIYYFDNNSINDYNIDGFNKNPEEWARFEKYNTDIKFRQLYCGCNLRLDNSYLINSIFFELTDEFGNPSIWILLPDNVPVLYHFSGERVYNYTYKDFGTSGVSVQHACQKFDNNGKLIK